MCRVRAARTAKNVHRGPRRIRPRTTARFAIQEHSARLEPPTALRVGSGFMRRKAVAVRAQPAARALTLSVRRSVSSARRAPPNQRPAKQRVVLARTANVSAVATPLVLVATISHAYSHLLVANETGSFSCLVCENEFGDGYASSTGASDCLSGCTTGFFHYKRGTSPTADEVCCPNVADGRGCCCPCDDNLFDCGFNDMSTRLDLKNITLQRNQWRITSNTIDARTCPLSGACRGGKDTSNYCFEGFKGVLCAVCEENWYHSSGTCVSCSGENMSSMETIWPILVFLVILVGGLLYCTNGLDSLREWLREWSRNAGSGSGPSGEESAWRLGRRLGLLLEIMKPKIRILVSLLQILAELEFNLSIKFPSLYRNFLAWFSFLNFSVVSILPLGCQYRIDYTWDLGLITLTPVAFVALLFLKHRWKPHPADFSWFLTITFLCLVPASSKICHVFKCDWFPDTKEEFLVVDYSIKCSTAGEMTPKFVALFLYALLMLMIFPVGIPCL